MPLIRSADGPTYTLGHVTFTGLASPSRGARETCAWRIRVAPGAPPALHTLDREEILVAVAGSAVATLEGTEHPIAPGDAIVVPAGATFAIANPYDEPFEAVAALPVGGRACFPGGEPFVPEWAA
jgi:mannose-6-phosphate isomerase-like protein (cupin superfamily)